jgi:hypothetical protein
MIVLYAYLALCFLWGCFAIFKQHQYPMKSVFLRYVVIFALNFAIFPYCLFLAAINNKLTFKNTYKKR